MFLLAASVGGAGLSAVLHRSLFGTLPSSVWCSFSVIASLSLMAFHSLPIPAFILSENAGVSSLIDIV